MRISRGGTPGECLTIALNLNLGHIYLYISLYKQIVAYRKSPNLSILSYSLYIYICPPIFEAFRAVYRLIDGDLELAPEESLSLYIKTRPNPQNTLLRTSLFPAHRSSIAHSLTCASPQIDEAVISQCSLIPQITIPRTKWNQLRLHVIRTAPWKLNPLRIFSPHMRRNLKSSPGCHLGSAPSRPAPPHTPSARNGASPND